MKFILLVMHIGFWCSCYKEPMKVAEYSTRAECEKARNALQDDKPVTNKFVCTEEPTKDTHQ